MSATGTAVTTAPVWVSGGTGGLGARVLRLVAGNERLRAVEPADCEVLVDGGIRSGTDLFRALALGARGVLIGRPWAWALAADGESAVHNLLTSWQRELQLAMTFAGVTQVADIGRSHLDRVAADATL